MINSFEKSIAVLMTCHNRRKKTLTCLDSLSKAKLPSNCTLDIFLVDDGSTDGTRESVNIQFPEVNIISGNGYLFWNQGMRLAWKTAAKKNDYDFYFWLNDDTFLDQNAIFELLECQNEAIKVDNNFAIIIGACRASKVQNEFSYGGRTKKNKPVVPNGCIQLCEYINGNAVLVPKPIYDRLGVLSSVYTHSIGDNDYGLMAINEGFKCYTTRGFIATCPKNEGPLWSNPRLSLKERSDHFYSPLGLNIKEYIIYRKKFWRYKWVYFCLIAYAKLVFPSTFVRTKIFLKDLGSSKRSFLL